jgi:hypothetical protein
MLHSTQTAMAEIAAKLHDTEGPHNPLLLSSKYLHFALTAQNPTDDTHCLIGKPN